MHDKKHELDVNNRFLFGVDYYIVIVTLLSRPLVNYNATVKF